MLGLAHSLFLYTTAIKIADALVALGAWYVCWLVRFHTDIFPLTKGLPELGFYTRVSLPLLLIISLMMHVVGAYRADRIQFGFRALTKIVEGSVLGTLIFVATCYFMGERDFSRVFLLLYATILMAGLLGERLLFHLAWRYWLNHGVRPIRILLVGSGDLLKMYVDKLNKRQPYPIAWVGQLSEQHEDRLGDLLLKTTPDRVVVAYPEKAGASYARILKRLSDELVDVRVLPDFGKYSTFAYTAQDECGVPLLAFNQVAMSMSDRAMKRVGDTFGALAMLVLFSPGYLIIAIAIKLTSKGPVLFSQERVGADNKYFKMYKFRTMRIDAEKTSGPVWAVKNDRRTTGLGKWLRRTSLDEMPQFWNVLRGDMSLVGPRPERPEFVEQFRLEIPKYMLRHKMKSGITGWAQVNGWRGNTSLNERIKHDLFYIGHWSHLFDLKILCLTVTRGFVNRHAY